MRHEKVVEVLNQPLARSCWGRPSGAAGLQRARRVPQVVPIGFYWNGAELVLASVSYAAKVKALVANPKVALTIDTAEPPCASCWCVGPPGWRSSMGWCRVPGRFRKGPPRISGRPSRPRSARSTSRWRIAVTPQWAKLIDFETTLPSAVQRAIRERPASS